MNATTSAPSSASSMLPETVAPNSAASDSAWSRERLAIRTSG